MTTDAAPSLSPMNVFEAAYAGRWNPAVIGAHDDAAGRDIIGFLDTGFPEEIAIAAGMLPVLLTGDPGGATSATDGKVDLGVPGRARQLYEGFLTGRYDFASAVGITGGDRHLANTYGFLDARRFLTGRNPDYQLFYLERARGTYREHRDFNRDRLALFRQALAAHTGRKIDDGALSEAIVLVNRSRSLLRQLSEARTATPGIISGTQAATISLAAMIMPKRDFNQALEILLAGLPAQKSPSDRLKVFLTGSPVDHTAVHQAVEEAGATVVRENVEFCGRYEDTPVREDIDPLEAIADRYTYKHPDAWAFGRDRRVARSVAMARESGADAVLFFHSLYDSSTGWDFPDLRTGLLREGLPTAAVQDQPYLPDPALSERIAAALDGIRPRREAEMAQHPA